MSALKDAGNLTCAHTTWRRYSDNIVLIYGMLDLPLFTVHKSVFSRVNSAVNTTLAAFAAERRAAAPLLMQGAVARRCRSICPARGVLSGKSAERRSCCRTTGQTDGHSTVT